LRPLSISSRCIRQSAATAGRRRTIRNGTDNRRLTMADHRLRRIIGSAVCICAALSVGGCGLLFPGPNPASVLVGDWKITPDPADHLQSFDIRASFNSDGKLTMVTATSPDGFTTRRDVDDSTTTEVNGDKVTLRIPAIPLDAVFEGTLSVD